MNIDDLEIWTTCFKYENLILKVYLTGLSMGGFGHLGGLQKVVHGTAAAAQFVADGKEIIFK